jgi:hypothetical protein
MDGQDDRDLFLHDLDGMELVVSLTDVSNLANDQQWCCEPQASSAGRWPSDAIRISG